jgi:glycosyltransferase involved in cell wall biosynthesis
MKLIYITNARIPTEKAHGIQIMKMCQTFAVTGLEVELVVPWRFNKIKKDPFDYYSIRKNFRIKKLPSLDIIPLGIPKICFWIQNLTFALSVFFYLILKKTDIIYSRDLFSLWLLSFFKKNIIYEAHTFPGHFFLYKRVFQKAKAVITITQKLKELLVEQDIPANKILVAPDGVDLKEFDIRESQEQCRQKLNLPLDRKIVGYVGQLKTMEMEKGIGCLIKVLKILKENNPLITLCLVGGQESDIVGYKKMASKMNLTNNILFIGQVRHCLIPYYLKSFDILVMPFPWIKHYAYYMSPLKMFEYMAAQKPIVASDLPSIREILSEKSAILVKPDSPQDLAKAINQTLKNPDFSAKISEQAYQDVQEYTWQKRVKKILNFIN